MTISYRPHPATRFHFERGGFHFRLFQYCQQITHVNSFFPVFRTVILKLRKPLNLLPFIPEEECEVNQKWD